MKPRMRYIHGLWECKRMGIIGRGRTMFQAWHDMWGLYREAVKTRVSYIPIKVREG